MAATLCSRAVLEFGDFFGSFDMDSNGLLSEDEVLGMLPEDASLLDQLRSRTIFHQADLDGDDSLNMDEFEFATFLFNELELQRKWVAYEAYMPAGFRQDLERLMDDLRRKYAAKVTLELLSSGLRAAAMYDESMEGRDHVDRMVGDLFDRADVVRDGFLNLNELDFFELVLRDSTIRAVELQNSPSKAPSKERKEREERLVNVFMTEFDVDMNGKLDMDEVVDGIRRTFEVGAAQLSEDPDMVASGTFVFFAQQHFAECDSDHDGLLDREETRKLIKWITKWR